MGAGRLSRRAAALEPSPTLWLFELASRLGGGFYRLHTGQPGVPPPRELVEALAARLAGSAGELGLYSYAPPWGLWELREAVAEDIAGLGGPGYEASEVVVTSGALEGVAAALAAVADPGDRVGLVVPAYFHFYSTAALLGLRVEEASAYPEPWRGPGEEGWARLFERSRVVVVANPDNPTGRLLGPGEAGLLADLACDHRVYLVHDVAYATVVYEGGLSWPEHRCPDYVITVGSYSKDPGIPGWRAGYAAAPRDVARAIAHAREAMSYNTPVPAQLLVLEYLRGGYRRRFLPRVLGEYRARRDALAAALRRLLPEARFHLPPAGFFIYADLSAYMDAPSGEWTRRLALEARVLTVPGTLFGPGGEGWVRLSFSGEPPHRLAEAVEAIARAAAGRAREAARTRE